MCVSNTDTDVVQFHVMSGLYLVPTKALSFALKLLGTEAFHILPPPRGVPIEITYGDDVLYRGHIAPDNTFVCNNTDVRIAYLNAEELARRANFVRRVVETEVFERWCRSGFDLEWPTPDPVCIAGFFDADLMTQASYFPADWERDDRIRAALWATFNYNDAILVPALTQAAR